MPVIAPTSALGRRTTGQSSGDPSDRQQGRGGLVAVPRAGQSRVLSAVEAAANILLGMGLSLALQILLFPLIGVEATTRQHLSLLAAFTGLSFLRVYILRRVFERQRRSAR